MDDVAMEEVPEPSVEGRSLKCSESGEADGFSTAVFAWGTTVNGDLGLGGIEEDHVVEPARVEFPDGRVKSSMLETLRAACILFEECS